MRSTILIATVVLLSSSAVHSQAPPRAPATPGVGMLENLPLAFVENQGQWDTPARFVARTGPLVARAEPDALVVQLERRDEEGTGEALVARLVFEGACEDVELVGENRQPGVRSYRVGEKARWRTKVPAYSKVLYRGLHEGIDLRLREGAGQLEYDLLLEPDAELERFVVRCEGISGLELEEDGSLVMKTDWGPVRQSPPETWQVLPSGERHGLCCRFVLLGEERFGFALEEPLSGLPVVIDPGIEWCTYFGGSSNDVVNHGTLDSAGRLIVVGQTPSSDFPATTGSLSGLWDGYVMMLDPSQAGANQLVWSTLVGGSGADRMNQVALDSAGRVYAVGSTNSTDLQSIGGAYDGTPNGNWDAIICELDRNTGTPLYLTFFGGAAMDAGGCLEVHQPGIVTFGGSTFSQGLPMPGAYQPTHAGARDMYVARLDLAQSGASALLYSTYLGGAGWDGVSEAVQGVGTKFMKVEVLPSGEFAVAWTSGSANYPTTSNAYDTTLGGNWDAVLTFIDPSVPGPAGLVYSTYIGGASDEVARALKIDDDGVATIGGYTYSSDFPTTPGAYDQSFYGPSPYCDAFLLQLDPTLGPPYDQQLLYSTFLCGDGYEVVHDLAFDSNGGVVAVGITGIEGGGLFNNGFPTTCGAYDESFNGDLDGFVVYLSPSGNGASDLLYSTYFGGPLYDDTQAVDLVMNGALDVVIPGNTDSQNLPLVNEFQGFIGGWECYAMRLELNPHNYCVAGANSAGPDGALICGTGSVSVAANSFELSVTGATASQTGLFYFGANPVEMPFGGGLRCIGGHVWRLNPALTTDVNGTVTRPLDFTAPPCSLISPGTNTYFQFWYRDPAGGGSQFNLSNGLKVYFYP